MPNHLTPLSQVQTATKMFPSSILSTVTAIPSFMLPGSVTCCLLIRPISLMQMIWKSQSSPMCLKSTARRVWFVWTLRTLSLAIVSGPIAQIEQEEKMSLNVSAEILTQAHVVGFFFYAYSNREPPLAGHQPTGTVTPWPWEGCTWIRPRIFIGTDQYPLPDTKSEVVRRALDPMTHGWPTTTSSRSGFRFSHASMWWAMMLLLSAIRSPRFRSSQSRAAMRMAREDGLLSLILSLMAGVGFLTFCFTEAVCYKVLWCPRLMDSVSNMSVVIHSYS